MPINQINPRSTTASYPRASAFGSIHSVFIHSYDGGSTHRDNEISSRITTGRDPFIVTPHRRRRRYTHTKTTTNGRTGRSSDPDPHAFIHSFVQPRRISRTCCASSSSIASTRTRVRFVASPLAQKSPSPASESFVTSSS